VLLLAYAASVAHASSLVSPNDAGTISSTRETSSPFDQFLDQDEANLSKASATQNQAVLDDFFAYCRYEQRYGLQTYLGNYFFKLLLKMGFNEELLKEFCPHSADCNKEKVETLFDNREKFSERWPGYEKGPQDSHCQGCGKVRRLENKLCCQCIDFEQACNAILVSQHMSDEDLMRMRDWLINGHVGYNSLLTGIKKLDRSGIDSNIRNKAEKSSMIDPAEDQIMKRLHLKAMFVGAILKMATIAHLKDEFFDCASLWKYFEGLDDDTLFECVAMISCPDEDQHVVVNDNSALRGHITFDNKELSSCRINEVRVPAVSADAASNNIFCLDASSDAKAAQALKDSLSVFSRHTVTEKKHTRDTSNRLRLRRISHKSQLHGLFKK